MKRKRKIVYIVSHVQKSLGFEWVSHRLKDEYDLSFILLNPAGSSLEDFLISERIPVERIIYRNKWDFPLALLKTIVALLFRRPEIVHAHLLDAQLIGLTAAWITGVKKRIYTRHNSNFHQAYEPAGVKYDRWSNARATSIVSISQSTTKTLIDIEKVDARKIVRIYHGFDWKEFLNVSDARVQAIREKWKIPANAFIVGVIARQIEWKGIQYIIPAFRDIVRRQTDAVLVLANASGPYHDEIERLLSEVSQQSVIRIPFEEDVAALYPTFDVYIHVPVDSLCEAFGQTYVEALACGVPSIFTLSGVAAEFVTDGANALVVPFNDSSSIFDALIRLQTDGSLRSKLIENGKRDVISRFGIDEMISGLKKLYDE